MECSIVHDGSNVGVAFCRILAGRLSEMAEDSFSNYGVQRGVGRSADHVLLFRWRASNVLRTHSCDYTHYKVVVKFSGCLRTW